MAPSGSVSRTSARALGLPAPSHVPLCLLAEAACVRDVQQCIRDWGGCSPGGWDQQPLLGGRTLTAAPICSCPIKAVCPQLRPCCSLVLVELGLQAVGWAEEGCHRLAGVLPVASLGGGPAACRHNIAHLPLTLHAATAPHPTPWGGVSPSSFKALGVLAPCSWVGGTRALRGGTERSRPPHPAGFTGGDGSSEHVPGALELAATRNKLLQGAVSSSG